MNTEPAMPLPTRPEKLDLLKHFRPHGAVVKLLALLLIVVRDVGVVSVPVAVAFAAAKHWIIG
jgi:hypothetical protein